jgi:hypothetical protein
MTRNATQYFSDYKIEKNEMGAALARMGKRRGVCRVFVGNFERNKPVESSRLR